MDIINDYFIRPILEKSGYNPVNTLVYGILVFIVVAFTIKVLEKMKVKIDKNFFIGAFPFIFLGSVLRVFEDYGILKGYMFVTPMVYVLIYVFIMASICISLFLEKHLKKPYWQIMFALGALPCLCALMALPKLSIIPLMQVLAIASAFGIIIFGLRKAVKSKKFLKFLTFENSFIILAHLFDASTTFVATQFYFFSEEHVLAGFLMGSFGNYMIFALKLVAIPIVLYLLDKSVDDVNARNFLKISVFIFGFGPGMRNLMSVMAIA